jgi:hypothetical protein
MLTKYAVPCACTFPELSGCCGGAAGVILKAARISDSVGSRLRVTAGDVDATAVEGVACTEEVSLGLVAASLSLLNRADHARAGHVSAITTT